eukprot:CCRYP_001564-RA/>CCRYP_001564-RA protein AED:0.37 eAED:0.41 QI:0/0/0/1/0/0/4/0/328
MKLSDIPQEIIHKYYLLALFKPDIFVYIMIIRDMYGLPHVGLIAQQLLETGLNKHRYHQNKLVPGPWVHNTHPVQFTLVVDDFGVGNEHALHLKSVFEAHYQLSTDWTGARYIGINLNSDFINRKVHLSMPGYVTKALKLFQDQKPSTLQHSPFPATPIHYGSKQQTPSKHQPHRPSTNTARSLCNKSAANSSFLVNPPIQLSFSANPTQDTFAHSKQLLNYLAMQEDTVLTYHASDMILAAHSNTSYLSETKACSRAGSHFFLSSNEDIPSNNCAILNIAHIIKHVMASATKAELTALYITACKAPKTTNTYIMNFSPPHHIRNAAP